MVNDKVNGGFSTLGYAYPLSFTDEYLNIPECATTIFPGGIAGVRLREGACEAQVFPIVCFVVVNRHPGKHLRHRDRHALLPKLFLRQDGEFFLVASVVEHCRHKTFHLRAGLQHTPPIAVRNAVFLQQSR